MSEQGHNSGHDSAKQQQAMSAGKGGGGHAMDINSAFGRKGDEMYALMHGHDVELAKTHGQTLAQLLGGDKPNSTGGDAGGNSASSSHGRGGGADSVVSANPGPVQPQQSKFVEDYYMSKNDKGRGF